MTDEKIRVLIADDSLFMRRMLRQMLSGDSRIEVVDEAADGVEAVAKCISLSPDVLVLDVEMPKLDGISVLKNIMSNRPLPVVMFSSLTQRGSQVTLEAPVSYTHLDVYKRQGRGCNGKIRYLT